jgi:GLPGLI family protein
LVVLKLKFIFVMQDQSKFLKISQLQFFKKLQMLQKIIILFLFTVSVFGQSNANFVYSVTPIPSEKGNLEEMMKSLDESYEYKVSTLEFNLVTNKKESSCFSISEKSKKINSGSVKMFVGMAGYNSIIKQSKDSVFFEINMEMWNKVYITKQPVESDWKITTESKEIMGYLCYKAVTKKTVINSVGTFVSDVIAWFCPKFPYPFGPIGYGNLPGLILELQTKNALFGITKIDLQSAETICEFNKSATVTTQKELDDLAMKHHEEFSEKLKN